MKQHDEKGPRVAIYIRASRLAGVPLDVRQRIKAKARDFYHRFIKSDVRPTPGPGPQKPAA